MAGTLPDEEDGKKDGWSDFAALYGLDLVKKGSKFELVVKVVSKLPGGTSFTPPISADIKSLIKTAEMLEEAPKIVEIKVENR